MIKLTDLLKEEETFTATSKKSGETAVFKTKDARDAAVKAGTHSKIKDSEDGDDKKDTPKVNIFDKPKKDEPKKDEPVRDDQTDAQIEDVQNNIDDMPGDEIQDYAESDIFPYLKGRDLELAKMYVDDIDAAGDDFDRSADLIKDLKDLFDKKMTLDSPKEEPKGEEPKKDEPVRDEYSDAQIDDVQNNIGDLDGDEMRDYAESDIFPYLKGKDF